MKLLKKLNIEKNIVSMTRKDLEVLDTVILHRKAILEYLLKENRIGMQDYIKADRTIDSWGQRILGVTVEIT